VVDVDEEIHLTCEAGRVLKMEKARLDTLERDMEYLELANEVLAKIKVRLQHNKKLRVLFLTSSLAWASQFKKDAVYVASPDSEFWDEIMKSQEDEEKRDVLRKARDSFIKSVPDARAISTYNSLKELERMVRQRFGIVHTL
jgi:bisphosphoglycerate-independent phosphoglycerate mutase (AlkP superfamily)